MIDALIWAYFYCGICAALFVATTAATEEAYPMTPLELTLAVILSGVFWPYVAANIYIEYVNRRG